VCVCEVDRACSAVVIALRSGTQGPGFEAGLFHKACYMLLHGRMKLRVFVCVCEVDRACRLSSNALSIARSSLASSPSLARLPIGPSPQPPPSPVSPPRQQTHPVPPPGESEWNAGRAARLSCPSRFAAQSDSDCTACADADPPVRVQRIGPARPGTTAIDSTENPRSSAGTAGGHPLPAARAAGACGGVGAVPMLERHWQESVL
jgi:hypothetical protein